MDPASGEILWSHPHDPGNDLNCGTPLWGGDDILFLSSAYKAGSRAIRLRQAGGSTIPEELWFNNRVRFMFLTSLRIGDTIYGTAGDFGPAFLTALDVKTGETLWQHRGFGRASLLQAGGKTLILDEDGDLALATMTPEGVTVHSEFKLFETTSWTVPTLAGTTLFARDREKVTALDLGAR
jgi:outer membrane protein assembly factor BamB